jgi:hypothetical protein
MSNDLMVALGALGGVVLAGLAAHGAWQARKAGPKKAAPAAARAEPRDSTRDGPRSAGNPRAEPREPVLGASGEPGQTDTVPGVLQFADDESSGRVAPHLGDDHLLVESAPLAHEVPSHEPVAQQPSARDLPNDALADSAVAGRVLQRRAVPRVDALIDVIVPMTLESPVTGDAVLSHLPGSRRAGSKPFFVEGLNADDGQWESPVAGQRYGELQAGLQMANRTGALTEIEYSEFVHKLQGFAEAVGAMADFPDMLDVAARARELDAFAGDHDAQMAVLLRARGAAWSIGYVLQEAARHGFVAGVLPGRLVSAAAEDGAPPVLTLTFDSQAALSDDPNQTALRELTLGFDVAQTDARVQPFAAWQRCAMALAQDMDAEVVDDRGQVLSADGFAFIDSELVRLYGALQTHGVAAGSAAARRLFS